MTRCRIALLLALCAVLCSCAAKREGPAPFALRSGELPASGTVVVRSGLAATSEDSPIFTALRQALTPALSARGLSLVTPPHTRPAASAARRPAGSEPRGEVTAPKGARLKLARYTVGQNDSDLPSSVMSISPPDGAGILFEQTQKQGAPTLVRAGRIPGVFPNGAIAKDSRLAGYTLVCRFAQASTDMGRPFFPTASGTPTGGQGSAQGENGGMLVAAELIRGVSRMGYGRAASPAPPRSSYGGSPNDYRRGYEGHSPEPGDPWNREADFKARNYMLRHGPAPEDASPPEYAPPAPPKRPGLPSPSKPPLPGEDFSRTLEPLSSRYGSGASASAYTAGARPAYGAGSAAHYEALPLRFGGIPCYGLELELYAHKPRLSAPVWRSIVWVEAEAPSLQAAMPELVRLSLAEAASE